MIIVNRILLSAIALMASSAVPASPWSNESRAALAELCRVVTGEDKVRDKVIDKPAFSSGGSSFCPKTVVRGQTATTIGFSVYTGQWSLAAESHLSSLGKNYRMTKATVFKRSHGKVESSEALDPSKQYTREHDSVSVEFEPLDMKVPISMWRASVWTASTIRLPLANPSHIPTPRTNPYAPLRPNTERQNTSATCIGTTVRKARKTWSCLD